MSKSSKFWEKYNAIFFAIGLTILFYYIAPCIKDFREICKSLNSLISSTSVTLIGFFITILTLIYSINSRSMKIVRESGTFPLLVSYIRLAIKIQFLTLIYTFIYFYIPEDYNIRQLGLIFLSSFCVISSYNFTTLFMECLSD